MARYSAELYAELEEETGLSTGFRTCGYLQLATTPARTRPAPRDGVRARTGAKGDVVPREVVDLAAASDDDIIHGVLDAGRGPRQPGRRAMSLAKGARARGREDLRGRDRSPASRPRTAGGGVRTERGDDRVREGRARGRAVGSRARRAGRRHRAAPGGRALLPAHRADRGVTPESVPVIEEPESLRLLPRGGRRPPGRDVRAGRQGLGAGRHAARTARSPCSRPTGTGWRRSSRSRCAASRRSRTPGSARSSAGRRASPTTCRRCSASRPRSTASTSPAA